MRLANPDRTHKMQMRIYGSICAAAGISFCCIYLANSNAYGHGKADFYILEYAVGFLVFAGGLLATKVWAELLFDLCLLCLSVGFVWSLFLNRETDVSQIALVLFIIAILMVPVALSMRRYKHGAYFLRGA